MFALLSWFCSVGLLRFWFSIGSLIGTFERVSVVDSVNSVVVILFFTISCQNGLLQ